MELSGWAFFFAYIGFLTMVLACWLFLPRASFVISIAVIIHKTGLMNLSDGKKADEIISMAIVTLMVIIGLIVDTIIIKEFFSET